MYARKSSIVSVEISRKRTDDFCASFYPSQTQCTATVPAVHCNRPCSALQPLPAVHCIRPCSALPLFPQTFATRVANVIIRPCKRLQPPS